MLYRGLFFLIVSLSSCVSFGMGVREIIPRGTRPALGIILALGGGLKAWEGLQEGNYKKTLMSAGVALSGLSFLKARDFLGIKMLAKEVGAVTVPIITLGPLGAVYYASNYASIVKKSRQGKFDTPRSLFIAGIKGGMFSSMASIFLMGTVFLMACSDYAYQSNDSAGASHPNLKKIPMLKQFKEVIKKCELSVMWQNELYPTLGCDRVVEVEVKKENNLTIKRKPIPGLPPEILEQIFSYLNLEKGAYVDIPQTWFLIFPSKQNDSDKKKNIDEILYTYSSKEQLPTVQDCNKIILLLNEDIAIITPKVTNSIMKNWRRNTMFGEQLFRWIFRKPDRKLLADLNQLNA